MTAAASWSEYNEPLVVLPSGRTTTMVSTSAMTVADLGVLQTFRCRWCRERTPYDRCHNCGGPQ